MSIASWNINPVRRRLPLVADWLAANKPDVLCLQETQVPDSAQLMMAHRPRLGDSSFRRCLPHQRSGPGEPPGHWSIRSRRGLGEV